MDKVKLDAQVTEVYLHVQVSNLEAKDFYVHHGFEEKDIILGYYKNIDPPDCFLLSKVISRN
jgi:ribosomal protein S18 acetylase RimI-like enzyme